MLTFSSPLPLGNKIKLRKLWMSFVLEQIALGSREMSPSNRIFLQTLEKSALSYWIRSSEDPDPQPFHLLRLPTDFLEVTEPVYSLSL